MYWQAVVGVTLLVLSVSHGAYTPTTKAELNAELNLCRAQSWSSTDPSCSDINAWNTSFITDMSDLFANEELFNLDISNWDTSSVTTMARMFKDCKAFDRDLSGWDVSKVTDMTEMFDFAREFHGRGLSAWNVGRVTSFSGTFLLAREFDEDLANWDVSSAVDMTDMFSSADIGEISASDLSNWDVSKVTSMHGMFVNAAYFNGDISSWNTGSVVDMSRMFWQAGRFNRDLSGWDTTSVRRMDGMFSSADTFNGDVTGWDVSRVEDMSSMFTADRFNRDISGWNTSSVTSMSQMFSGAIVFNADISGWNVGNVVLMNSMFYNAEEFNRDIGKWDVRKVTTMQSMFAYTEKFRQNLRWETTSLEGDGLEATFTQSKFNGDISGWDVSRVTSLRNTFKSAVEFRGDVSRWDTREVADMWRTFFEADKFSSDVGGWDVSKVTTMYSLFRDTSRFSWDLNGWDVSKVDTMDSLFFNAQAFNGNISEWNPVAVDDMDNMFHLAVAFNHDISRWNVSRVRRMENMFERTEAFSQDLAAWDTSSLTSTEYMFRNAKAFNGNLSTWDVSSVTDFDAMFQGAVAFNQELSRWDVAPDASASRTFDGCPKLSFQDVDECLAGTHHCAAYAECKNTAGPPGSFICECDLALCQDRYNCTAALPARTALQVQATPRLPSGTHFVWSDALLATSEHSRSLLRLPLLPPVANIGKATLVLSKDISPFHCRLQVLRAYHADFECCVDGAGVRRLHAFDPPLERTFPVPSTTRASAEVLLDVTAFVRGATADAVLAIEDPHNCLAAYASPLHPDTARRPTLLLEWNDEGDCAFTQPLEATASEVSELFSVGRGTRAEVQAECGRRGAVLAAVDNEAEAAAAVAACSDLPCWIQNPSGEEAFSPWLPGHPISGRQGTAVWSSQGMWQSVDWNQRLSGLCRLCPAGTYLSGSSCRACSSSSPLSPPGSTSSSDCKSDLCDGSGGACSCPDGWEEEGGECVDVDECAAGTHSCMDSAGTYAEFQDAVAGLTHWYKFDPSDPLADSVGGHRLVQTPDTTVDHLYSRTDCLSSGESCAHWSPQPTPPFERWDDNDDLLRWQVPLDGFQPTTGVTVSMWYKRWTTNQFGPRQRNLLCLRNTTVSQGEGEGEGEGACLWALQLSSALHVRLATQAVSLSPAGVFAAEEVNLLDVERWYHVALVLSAGSRARLYIDFEPVGPELFLVWDPALYRPPHTLQLDVIRMEARADVKVFSRALDPDQLRSRFAYRPDDAADVTTCSNTVGSFVCDCDQGFRAASASGSCQDANPCDLGTHNCQDPAVCEPTSDGWYQCSCPEGNSADSLFSCTFNDICATGDDTCHGFALCTPTTDSFECECLPGWEGNGVDCRAWDPTVHVTAIKAAADGWVQPWLPEERVEQAGSELDRSFATPYLAVGSGTSRFTGSKHLRTVMQFDNLPAGLFLVHLELTHIWRSDPDYCGRFLNLTLTQVEADAFEALDAARAVRRLEEVRPAVSLTVRAPNHGWETGRVLIDVSDFVAAAAPDGGRLAFTVTREPGADAVCDDWFSPSSELHRRGPQLHVAYRDVRGPALGATMALEPALDATVHVSNLADANRSLDQDSASLDVDSAHAALFHFEGLPPDMGRASLVISQAVDGGAGCEDGFGIELADVSWTNGSISNIGHIGYGRTEAVTMHAVQRVLALDLSDFLRRHAAEGAITFVLHVVRPECRASLRSSRFIATEHYGHVNVRRSERPWLAIEYDHRCDECRLWLSAASVLMRSGDCGCLGPSLGFANRAIRDVDPEALHDMTWLETLDLSGNNLATLPAGGLFRDLSSLRVLDLSGNRIASIEAGALDGMPRLEALWLQRNQLSVLADGTFAGLSTLRSLSLSRNQIGWVELGALRNLTGLVWLDLSFNDLVSVDFFAWDALQSLEAISLADNAKLSCIPMIPDGLAWFDFTMDGGGFRFFFVQPICLPYGCPAHDLEFDLDALLAGDGKAFHSGVGQALQLMRRDAVAPLDLALRTHSVHVARGDQLRCVCNGAPWCVSVPNPLGAEGDACSASTDCQSNACCDGQCAPLLRLDHRGPLCPVAPPRGFRSALEGRAIADANECVEQTDDCDADAMCINTEGSFECFCFPGFESVGAIEGLECEDVDECGDPERCDAIPGAIECVNTPGSFGCTRVLTDFGVVLIEARYEFPPPGSVGGGPAYAASELTVNLRHIELPRLMVIYGDSWAEKEGAKIVALIGRLNSGQESNHHSRFLSRRRLLSDADDEPATAQIAGSAVSLSPEDAELLNPAEVFLPIDEETDFANRVFRAWRWDRRDNVWEPLETLGLSSDGRSVRALTSRFGVLVAVAVCPGGTVSVSGAVPCDACPAGSYSDEHATACSECGEGTYAEGASSGCVLCAAGSYSDQLSASACDDCPVGQASTEDGTTCSECGAGTFASGADCVPCPRGEFSTGATDACEPCEGGSSSEEGATSCSDCSLGHFAPPGGSDCFLCPAGTFSVQTAASSCSYCPDGEASTANRTACAGCPAGTFAWGAECVLCPRGKFAAEPTDECWTCSGGSTSETGATVCSDCVAGSFAPAGAPECALCSANSFAAQGGASTCETCAAGESAEEGAIECVDACSDGRHNAWEQGEDCGGPWCGQCCGNGRVDPGEDCDSGGAGGVAHTCTEACQHATCSDGLRNQGETSPDCGGPCLHLCGSQSAVAIAALGNDRVVVAWESVREDGSGNGIRAKVMSVATGEDVLAEFRVNVFSEGDQDDVVVAALGADKFVVAWESWRQDASSNGVYARVMGVDGEEIRGEFRLNEHTSGSQDDVSVAAIGTDKFIIAWESWGQDGDEDGIYARVMQVEGDDLMTEFRVNDHTDETQGDVSVAGIGEDKFVVAWESEDQDGDEYGVYATVMSISGTTVLGEFRVNNQTDGYQQDVAVAAVGNDTIAFAWESPGVDSRGVFARVISISGGDILPEFLVNNYTDGAQDDVSVSALAGDVVVFAWESYGQDGSDDGVYTRAVSLPSGDDVLSEVQLNNETDGYQTDVVVAAVGDKLVFAWESEVDQDEYLYQVRTRVLSLPSQTVEPCTEPEANLCHVLGMCSGSSSVHARPAGVSLPAGSDGRFVCECFPGQLGHGYGASGCANNGWNVRLVYRGQSGLSRSDKEVLLSLLGGVTCAAGAADGCDHLHLTWHGPDLGVNVLFPATPQGRAAAEAAAASFNTHSAAADRRSDLYPSAVDPTVGARVYAWDAGSVSSPVAVPPAGMEVEAVSFEAACGRSGCWVLEVVFTTGSSDGRAQDTFNTFFLPYAVGSDALSFDFDYGVNGITDTFTPANFPCRVSDYSGAESLPVRATACCLGAPFDANVTALGGDGGGSGLRGKYRVTEAFAAYAEAVYPQLCPGGYDAPNIDDNTGGATTPRPEDLFPDGSSAGSHRADDFVSPGRFVGMPHSPGVTATRARDAFIGQFEATIRVDEVELRGRAGLLRGTVGVEHTVDFFLGFANFKPATGTWILDSLASQTAIHVEKTSFFSVSTHGTNDYTFLEYVNLRLVAVYQEDADFSGAGESSQRTVRTNQTRAAHYVQVTFTLGAQYGVNANSGLVPLDSVRAGRGVFLAAAEAAGAMQHKCLEYTGATPANAFASPDLVSRFNQTLLQPCAPAAAMCQSPAAIPDSFVSFNIPLGFEVLGEGSDALDSVVFVDLVISAIDLTAVDSTAPNDGEAPWQMKTTLTASIPIVDGGVNIFCDGFTAKTDLKDVADVDIVVGSASSVAALTRLRIMRDVGSTQLTPQGEVVMDSDSIEAGLMTLVLKGNASFFASTSVNNRQVSLELEDVITIHIMESDGAAADGAGSQGKQQVVKDLLAEAPDDNADSAGLDTDGYGLNGAFFFTIDRSAQRAHLEPSERLLQQCPFNPPRPADSGNVVLETCVTRRDVRYRGFPHRAGAMSTAMEVSASAGQSALPASSPESRFLSTVLGDSAYARQLAADFAAALDTQYSLDGRFRRAFWVNPGYEWAPTQTGGQSLFQVSQKLFLFALITLDEKIATDPGASVPDTPRLPSARRTLLSVVTPETDTSLSSAELAFPVTRSSLLSSALDVPPERMATLGVGMRLSPADACLDPAALQQRLTGTLRDYLSRAGSAVDSVQVLSLTVNRGGADCSGRSTARRASSSVEMEVLVVFASGGAPSLDLQALSQLPDVLSVDALSVPERVAVRPVAPRSVHVDDAEASSSSTVLIAGIAAGSAALVAALVGFIFVYRRRASSHAEGLTRVGSTESSSAALQLKTELAFDRVDGAAPEQREEGGGKVSDIFF